ncbi:hybrid-cluster NAD(P)-dependent oxidoreductase [Devosia psychrophila]|uniref:Ferredoxin n=1 Tax=Devosia psychrophila TaxID=728005 RepID=A0A0F5PUY7_9HYPH|nr:hybrid-cluster NAD(P)-dependent oxidoreductase [Devosia psychrophila]KKC32430.1 ferredoxin [Devosia psychrophila]SFC13105.1 Ferredoxin-NADP reductase [Devosia psychrophila]
MKILDGGFGPIDAQAPALKLPDDLWDSENDDTLICQSVRQETHDVKTFVLRPTVPGRFRYQPGQFMTYAFEIGGETLHRCYTISSAPTRPHTISFTVKRVPGGRVSNWLHDNLKPGMAVKALGPMGEFTCYAHPAPKYLFLSGGSGITPLMSMARTFHDLGEQEDLVFVHSARTSSDIIFREELELMARLTETFRFVPIVEGVTPLSPSSGLRGRLSRALLDMIVPDYMSREIFVCGPSPYMAAVKALLVEAGFDMSHHHDESFNFEELSATEQVEVAIGEVLLDAAPQVKTYTVEFTKTRRSIEVPENMTVLEAAKRAGMRLPSSCTQGLCGTCKSKKVSGTIEMNHKGGIRQREIDAGMMLLCCSKPTSDLVIER